MNHLDTLNLLTGYFLRSLPGFMIGVLFILLIGKKSFITRIFSYVLLFIMIRDVMTPLGLWSFGTEGVFWLRVIENPGFLLVVAILSVGIVLVVNRVDREAGDIWIFRRTSYLKTVATGLAGAALVFVPMLLIYQFVPIEQRGGAVTRDPAFLASLLIFCLSANFLEESIYRGYFQGYIVKLFSPAKSAVLSGLLFSFSHIFLATTVTDAGWGVIAFTAFEGIVAGFVYLRGGVLAATITHGGAIFLLCSGLF